MRNTSAVRFSNTVQSFDDFTEKALWTDSLEYNKKLYTQFFFVASFG